MFNRRLLALLIKETIELLRNRQLVVFMLILPVVSMVIFGYVLNSNVTHLRLSILDRNQTQISREFVDAFTANQVFVAAHHPNSQQELTQQVQRGQVDAGLIVPPNFSRDLLQTGKSEIPVMIDGINAYSAGLARSYVAQITAQFNLNLLQTQQPLALEQNIPIQPQIAFRYNPGTIDSWFFVPGVIGMIVTVHAILGAAVE
ncbi:ABC transporter permease, partial [Chroococcidiopsidales cyanobacterium LEGE 13417]|nr:ABC transporter permease [Chroococcidiopsidales cyanobacterium LEGE 13417]